MQTYRTGPIRDYLFPLAALGASMLASFELILMLFIVTGQAHFLTAYWYQYRAGKMDVRYLLVAGVLFIAAIAYFFMSDALLPLLFLVGVLFSAHFAYDELQLHGEASTKAKLVTVAGFTAFFSALVVTFAVPALAPFAPFTLTIPVLALIVRFLLDPTKPGKAERYLWLVEAVIFFIAVGLGQSGTVLGVIVLLHVANWYVGFGTRLARDPVRLRAYWTQVVLILMALTLLFLIYLHARTPLLEFLFKSTYYYAWAIAHIVLSFIASLPRRIAIPAV